MDKCFLCDQHAEVNGRPPLKQILDYSCPNCGRYSISDKFKNSYAIPDVRDNMHLLSGYVREMNELGKLDIYISSGNYKDILASPFIPHTIGAKLEKFLHYGYLKTQYFGEILYLDLNTNYAICYAKNPDEADSLFDQLNTIGWINQIDMSGDFTLTLEGVLQAEHNKIENHQSNTCFVAMWFGDEMNSIYEEAIKPAIEANECGAYSAFRVDNKQHNNDITDEIIAGIRECRFMVADMTGYRGGVYFEAGFAKGLGKQVIFTCRKDWFEGEIDKEGNVIKEKVHFDINHQNIIVWENNEDLKKRIIDRIRATIF